MVPVALVQVKPENEAGAEPVMVKPVNVALVPVRFWRFVLPLTVKSPVDVPPANWIVSVVTLPTSVTACRLLAKDKPICRQMLAVAS